MDIDDLIARKIEDRKQVHTIWVAVILVSTNESGYCVALSNDPGMHEDEKGIMWGTPSATVTIPFDFVTEALEPEWHEGDVNAIRVNREVWNECVKHLTAQHQLRADNDLMLSTFGDLDELLKDAK